MDYSKHFSVKETPATQAVPGMNMTPNNGGGYGFKADKMEQLDRFLILGTEGGTYYVNESKLTIDNANNVVDCIKSNGIDTVNRIKEVSEQGRAPKNGPALFALALCTSPKFANVETRRAAFDALPAVARIGTHLFEFVTYMQNVRGWGKLAQTSIRDWYQLKDPKQLEYQLVKYRQRGGWTHNDILRLAKPTPMSLMHDQLYEFAKRGTIEGEHDFKLIEGYNRIQHAGTVKKAVRYISDYRLPMEAVPTQFKKDPAIWEALLPHLPITATIRNLRNMAKYNFLVPMSEAAKTVADRISNEEIIKKGRVHPMQYLNAIINYPVGQQRCLEGGGCYKHQANFEQEIWKVAPNVVEALNEGFQLGFQNVTPTGLRTILALDVSGSMSWEYCAGSTGITPREASAALALITVNVEPNHILMTFSERPSQFTGIRKGMHVDQAIKAVSNLRFGATNIAAPMLWALENNLPVDVINCYTDNENNYGHIHPCQALDKLSNKFGTNTKFVSVAMAGNARTVADPNNKNMLDIVGFDTATPRILSEFATMK